MEASPMRPSHTDIRQTYACLREAFTLLLFICGVSWAAAAARVADSPQALASLVAAAKPGDEIVLEDGVYFDFRAELKGGGEAARPIVVHPRTVDGVTFKGRTHIALAGVGVVVQGFRFNNCLDTSVHFGGTQSRLSACTFESCGSLVSTFSHIVRVGLGANDNRIDHCTFARSRSLSIGVDDGWYGGHKELGVMATGTRIDHNTFRDIHRLWFNGQEAIQLGQGQKPEARARAVIEHNLFDDASGDTEIFSLKTGNNTIRYNVANNCRGSLYFRCGDANHMEGNVVVACDRGFTVMGTGHTESAGYCLAASALRGDQPHGWTTKKA